MSRAYWQSAADDEAMQDEHSFAWRAILETIDIDLSGKRVLDVGCNRGGFLRLLADGCAIAEGCGYDPASGAIEDARRFAGQRPLHFEISDALPAGWRGFDLAFSHEVLYLLHDLPAHARAMRAALAPGGVYYAVNGIHAGSPLMANWHHANAARLGLPRLYDIDEVIVVFNQAGFDAAAARLAVRFIPTTGQRHNWGRLSDWITYYYDHKLLLRFSLPPHRDGA